MRSFCCYAAAEGSRPMFNITRSRFLSSIDPTVYFKKQLPNLRPSNNDMIYKKKVRLAYYIMIHLLEGFENLKQLINILDDGLAIILIHVDLRVGSDFINAVKAWVATLPSKKVQVASTLFEMCWGCSSLVTGQLNGFFELLDLSEWDYVINLSNYDYPLLRNQQIYEALEQTKGYNRVSYWANIWEGADRLIRPVFISNKIWKSFSEFGVRYFAYREDWIPVKASQWASYSREFIEFLRNDQTSLELLAFISHTEIPDESYFALGNFFLVLTFLKLSYIVIMNTDFKNKTTSDNNRYIPFSGIHARFVTFEDAPSLVYNSTTNPISLVNFHDISLSEKYKSKYHFCRKLDAVSVNNTNLKLWIQNKLYSY